MKKIEEKEGEDLSRKINRNLDKRETNMKSIEKSCHEIFADITGKKILKVKK